MQSLPWRGTGAAAGLCARYQHAGLCWVPDEGGRPVHLNGGGGLRDPGRPCSREAT